MKNSYYKNLFKTLFTKPSFLIPFIIFIVLFLTSLTVYLLCDSQDLVINLDAALANPSSKHIFGTNEYGQDFFSVVFIGVFNTLLICALASFINLVLGTVIGIIWGSSPKCDAIMLFIKNILDNIPSIFFYIIIISSLGSGIPSLLLIILLFNWINTACLIRNNLIILRSQDFNKVSKLLKTPYHKIALYNYLPSLLPIIFNSFAVSFPQIISLEITLSYFGFNLTNQNISLGNVLYSSISNNYCFSHPYLFVIPFSFLLIINICYFYIGKAISDFSNKEVKNHD